MTCEPDSQDFQLPVSVTGVEIGLKSARRITSGNHFGARKVVLGNKQPFWTIDAGKNLPKMLPTGDELLG